jgi:hypothetical protein
MNSRLFGRPDIPARIARRIVDPPSDIHFPAFEL